MSLWCVQHVVIAFLVDLYLKLQHSTRVDSASNRNEHQETWGIKGDQSLRLITSSSLGPLFRKCGIFDVSQTYRPLRPARLRVLYFCCLGAY
jgi:hypothetical protein